MPSAPRTSSSPTAPARRTSATPRTAPAPARPPTPTAATSDSLPLGTKVDFVEGGSLVTEGTRVGGGTLVYTLADHAAARRDRRDTCAYNDLALVKVDAADVAKVNPSIPFWGGPVGINTAGTAAGDTVYSYGNSSLRGGIEQLSPQAGRQPRHRRRRGWSHPVYTVTPGVPGDSGSAFLDAEGKALGVLSTLAIAPLAGSNGVGDLAHELAYAQANTAASPACAWCPAPSPSARSSDLFLTPAPTGGPPRMARPGHLGSRHACVRGLLRRRARRAVVARDHACSWCWSPGPTLIGPDEVFTGPGGSAPTTTTETCTAEVATATPRRPSAETRTTSPCEDVRADTARGATTGGRHGRPPLWVGVLTGLLVLLPPRHALAVLVWLAPSCARSGRAAPARRRARRRRLRPLDEPARVARRWPTTPRSRSRLLREGSRATPSWPPGTASRCRAAAPGWPGARGRPRRSTRPAHPRPRRGRLRRGEPPGGALPRGPVLRAPGHRGAPGRALAALADDPPQPGGGGMSARVSDRPWRGRARLGASCAGRAVGLRRRGPARLGAPAPAVRRHGR